MDKSDYLPNCRFCPLQKFELVRLPKPNAGANRYMGICHARELVLKPIFPSGKIEECQAINKANVNDVTFELPDNCPYLDQLRSEGKIPWASASINFSN